MKIMVTLHGLHKLYNNYATSHPRCHSTAEQLVAKYRWSHKGVDAASMKRLTQEYLDKRGIKAPVPFVKNVDGL
jgi:hypothetical protein